jgi:hypothetical protein
VVHKQPSWVLLPRLLPRGDLDEEKSTNGPCWFYNSGWAELHEFLTARTDLSVLINFAAPLRMSQLELSTVHGTNGTFGRLS